MNFSLVKKADFNGVECDFYRKEESEKTEIYMTREQIGRALEYEQPMKAVAKIHERNRDRLAQFSTIVNLTTVEGGRMVQRNMVVYSPKGVYEICRWSRQPKADAFMDWVWEMVEQLRTGGAHYDMAAVIAETVRVTLTEVTKQFIPVIKEVLAGAAAAQPQARDIHIYNDSDNVYRPCRKRHAIIDCLSDEMQKEVEHMICSPQYTLHDVTEMLREYGIKISIASVHRYSKRLVEAL